MSENKLVFGENFMILIWNWFLLVEVSLMCNNCYEFQFNSLYFGKVTALIIKSSLFDINS